MHIIRFKLFFILNIYLVLLVFLISKDISAEQAVTIIADEIRSNSETDEVDAQGDVLILNHDGTKIKADKIIYDKLNQKVNAKDNIVINDQDGNTYFLDEAISFDGINYLEGNNVKARMSDNSRIVSKDIFKKENITLLTDAEYTPCRENNYLIKDCPAWKLKAKKIYQDSGTRTIHYDHAKIYLFNIPFLYLPYFSHPDPSVNKRSGFLMPTIETDNNLGEKFSVPYFFNIAGNRDITFTPNFQSQANNYYAINYRELNDFGNINIDGSIDDNDDNKGTKNHIFVNAEINNPYGNLELDIKTSNNDTYLRKNKVNQLTVHESGLKFNKSSDNSYFNLAMSSYKHLTIQETNQWEYVYPQVEYNIDNIKLQSYDGRVAINNIFRYQKNLDETYASLASTQINWLNRNIDQQLGLLFDNEATLRVISISNDFKDKKDTENVRFFPQVSSKISFPLFKSSKNSNQTLTPILMPIIAPYNNYTDHKSITNSNLFSTNRASLITESESGPRINYGIEWFNAYKDNLDIKVVAGQNLKFNKEKSDTADEVSDFYITSNFIFDDNKYFNNSLIIDKDNHDVKTNNANLLLAMDNFSLGIDYDYNSGKYYTASEQIRIGSKFEFANNFQFNLNGAKNIDTNNNIGYQYGLLYENDCIGIDLNYYRDLTKDRDVAESYGYSFTIVLKPFGSTRQYGNTKIFGPKL
tara:strand:+ start:2230 stop:4320 length:2091 start_codon:yes stop_codon:yes gene_type:complete